MLAQMSNDEAENEAGYQACKERLRAFCGGLLSMDGLIRWLRELMTTAEGVHFIQTWQLLERNSSPTSTRLSREVAEEDLRMRLQLLRDKTDDDDGGGGCGGGCASLGHVCICQQWMIDNEKGTLAVSPWLDQVPQSIMDSLAASQITQILVMSNVKPPSRLAPGTTSIIHAAVAGTVRSIESGSSQSLWRLNLDPYRQPSACAGLCFDNGSPQCSCNCGAVWGEQFGGWALMPSLILEALLTAPGLYINQLQFSQHSLGVRGVRALLRSLETNTTVKHASFGDAMGENHEWVQALALSCTLLK
jgi:hypothetical protein